MSGPWSDRDAADDDPFRRFGRPGGDWQGLRPTLDNPMTWSVAVGRALGITVRVHLIFLVFAVVELLSAARAGAGGSVLGFWPAVAAVGLLLIIVLLHEYGHCLACRRAGGEADEILLWPLGGLAYCRPPYHWRAHLITVVGGPAVNVAIAAVLIPVLGFATGTWWGVAIPNPLSYAGLYDAAGSSWLLMTLYLANHLNLIVLGFNVLLPLFPLDGGRILQALLWPRLGYARSMRIAVRVGYFGAIGLLIAGLVLKNFLLVGVALFGGITCWLTHQQLRFTEEMMGFDSDVYGGSLAARPHGEPRPPRPTWRTRLAARRARRQRREKAAVDDILRKIASSGLESLTGAEKRRLRRATRQERRSG